MSRAKHSSSARTGEPKSWQEIAALGNRICEDLSNGRELDTLRTWMAHRISELMKLAEAAKADRMRKSLKKECADLILSLWRLERGCSLDNPIHTLNRTICHIVEMRPRLGAVISSQSPVSERVSKNPKSSLVSMRS